MMLIAPIKTEKAVGKIEYENALTFRVKAAATKDTVKKDVETLFGVKVASVRTLISSKGEKHAVVKLAKGFKADDVAIKLKMIA
jgi:ribosomal protein L23